MGTVIALTIASVVSVLFAGTILALLAIVAICVLLGVVGAFGIVLYMSRRMRNNDMFPTRARLKAIESQEVIQGIVIHPGGRDGVPQQAIGARARAIAGSGSLEREPVPVRDRLR